MILKHITLWLFNIAMENGPFIDGLPIKNNDFPMAMLNNQMVKLKQCLIRLLVFHMFECEKCPSRTDGPCRIRFRMFFKWLLAMFPG